MSGDTLIYISTFGQIKLVLKFEAKSKFNDAVFVQVVLFNHLNESDLIYLLSTDKRILYKHEPHKNLCMLASPTYLFFFLSFARCILQTQKRLSFKQITFYHNHAHNHS